MDENETKPLENIEQVAEEKKPMLMAGPRVSVQLNFSFTMTEGGFSPLDFGEDVDKFVMAGLEALKIKGAVEPGIYVRASSGTKRRTRKRF